MSITEKTAYLKGLLEDMNLDDSKPEGKLLKAIVETLDTMAAEVADLNKETEYIEDYLDELDYDLGDLESDYYEMWDDEDDDEFDEDDDDFCLCDECDAEDCTDCILDADEDEEDED